MEIEDFIRELQALEWAWTQDAMSAILLRRGWQPHGGTTHQDGERRTYRADCGWTWSVMSKAGAVFWQSVTVLRIDSTDEAVRRRSGEEHELMIPRFGAILGAPEYDGTALDDPGNSPFHSANRITRWRLGSVRLTLSHTDMEPQVFPAWVAIEIEPAARSDGTAG